MVDMRGYRILASVLLILLRQCESRCHSSEEHQQRLVLNRYGSQEWRDFFQLTLDCQEVELPLNSDENLEIQQQVQQCLYSGRICLTNLLISSSNLSIVPSSSFSSLPSLTNLYLEKQNIITFTPGAFNGIQSLKAIYLSRNLLTKIGEGIFNSLFELETLDLSRNKIELLERHSLTGLNNLKLLNLSSNILTSFENFILDKEGIRLNFLDLSFNKISMMDSELELPEIENMDLSNNMLVELDFCIAEFSTLNVSHNRITQLQDKSCTNSNLTMQIFVSSFNEISNLDAEFFSTFQNLRIIEMQHNNISIIPNGLFSNLHNLLSLNMSNNNIEDFDHGTFDSLENLEILDISHNMLRDIRRYLHSLQNLKELHIEYNKMLSLDSDNLFGDLRRLKHLYLYNNNFSCENLIEIIGYCRNHQIHIGYGNVKNVSNIHGIFCTDNADFHSTTGVLENINSEFEKIIMSKLGQMSDKEFKKSAMYEYFNSDFKNSNFYKYMEGLQKLNAFRFNETRIVDYFNKDFENSKFFKYLESFRNAENFSIEFNKSVYNYFNSDFRNSNFVKYLDDLKNANDLFNNGFSKTSMFNFFNDEFKDTTFYKYLESLRIFSKLLNSSSRQNFSGTSLPETMSSNNEISSVMIILFLVILSCNLFYITYLIKKKNNANATTIDQVELMDA